MLSWSKLGQWRRTFEGDVETLGPFSSLLQSYHDSDSPSLPHTIPATVFDKSNGPSWPWVVISGTVSHGVARGKGARHMRGVNVPVVTVFQNYTVRGRGPLSQVAPFTSVARKPGHEARLFAFCIFFFNTKA